MGKYEKLNIAHKKYMRESQAANFNHENLERTITYIKDVMKISVSSDAVDKDMKEFFETMIACKFKHPGFNRLANVIIKNVSPKYFGKTADWEFVKKSTDPESIINEFAKSDFNELYALVDDSKIKI